MSPARIAWSRITEARRPDAHTLLIVSEETSLGMPALICAWREGICPWPACRTWPITTCSTRSGSTSARSSAALMACPPSSVASRVDSPPPSLPIGVRAVPRMTVLGLGDRDTFAAECARVAAATAHRRVAELGTRVLCWELPHHVGDDVAGALVEGTVLAAYRFDRYKEPPDEPPPAVDDLIVSAHHD